MKNIASVIGSRKLIRDQIRLGVLRQVIAFLNEERGGFLSGVKEVELS